MPTNTTHTVFGGPGNTNNTRTIDAPLLIATINDSNVDTERGAR
jgi:hypothetical protein